MTSTAKEYGTALFELAFETGTCEAVFDGLTLVIQALRQEPEYMELLASPAVPKKERTATLQAAFSGRVPEYVVSFLCLLCENGRIRDVFESVEAFEQLYRESRKVSTAQVVSAVSLSADEQARLKEALEAKTGRSVTLECTVDPTLIGGIIVEWDGKCLDGSVKRRLQVLKEVIDQ